MNFLGLSFGNEIFSASNLFIIFIAIFWMIFASIQDIKRREVENWWNFSLIIFVLVFRALLSIETLNYWYFIWGLIGLVFGLIVANLFYYARLFAAGDAKLLMALGTILPLSLDWFTNVQIALIYLVLLLFAGSVYGIIYSLGMMIWNFKNFKKEFVKQFKKYRKLILYVEFFSLIGVLVFVYLNFYLGLALCSLVFLSPILLVYAKSIEEACMIKIVDKKQLTIGDWLYSSIKIGNKKINPNWEGLSEKELDLIQKKYKGKVAIKQGLPFVPAFLIAFICLLLLALLF